MPTLRNRGDAVVTAIGASRSGLAAAVVRRSGSPRMYDLYRAASSWNVDARSMLEASFGVTQAEASVLIAEANAMLAKVLNRAENVRRAYPVDYAVEDSTAGFLYAAIRLIEPRTVLETGVADGLSSALIIAAMDANGSGELHSVDIAHDVGSLVGETDRWHLHVVDGSRPESCADTIALLPQLDLFVHDGNHEREYQAAEYAAAWQKLPSGGVLMSDDVDWSYAFLDLLDEHRSQATMLMDRRKVLGLVRKS